MVPTQLMCTHNHTTVGQYTTPTDEISQPNPRGTRAHAPLLPRGGEGESCARTPLFPRGFLLLGYRQPPPGGCYLSRACARVVFQFMAWYFYAADSGTVWCIRFVHRTNPVYSLTARPPIYGRRAGWGVEFNLQTGPRCQVV